MIISKKQGCKNILRNYLMVMKEYIQMLQRTKGEKENILDPP